MKRSRYPITEFNPYEASAVASHAKIDGDALLTFEGVLSCLSNDERKKIQKELRRQSPVFRQSFGLFTIPILSYLTGASIYFVLMILIWFGGILANFFVLYLSRRFSLNNLVYQTSSGRIIFKALKDGFSIQSSNGELLSQWYRLGGVFHTNDKIVLLVPSSLHPIGLCIENVGAQAYASQLRSLQRARLLWMPLNVSQKLLTPHQFIAFPFRKVQAVFRGVLRRIHFQSEMRDQCRHLYAFYATAICSGILAIVIGLDLLRSPERDSVPYIWADYLAMSLGLIFCLVSLVLWLTAGHFLNPNTKVSDIEYSISEEGLEIRTNATHGRYRWELYQDAIVTDDKLTAICALTQSESTICCRDYFASEEDWLQVSKMILQSINRHQSVSHPFPPDSNG